MSFADAKKFTKSLKTELEHNKPRQMIQYPTVNGKFKVTRDEKFKKLGDKFEVYQNSCEVLHMKFHSLSKTLVDQISAVSKTLG